MSVGGAALTNEAMLHVQGKYKSNEQQSFSNTLVVDPAVYGIEGVFLKVAVLGGMCRDTRVPKGWILFR